MPGNVLRLPISIHPQDLVKQETVLSYLTDKETEAQKGESLPNSHSS